MDDSAALGRRFDAAMLDIYHGAARLGYRPTRFLEMVQVYGGVETAHRLLATEKIQDGLASSSSSTGSTSPSTTTSCIPSMRRCLPTRSAERHAPDSGSTASRRDIR